MQEVQEEGNDMEVTAAAVDDDEDIVGQASLPWSAPAHQHAACVGGGGL